MKNENISVLLLEDNPAQYALLSAYLEKDNYKVVHVDCIKAFNSLIKTEHPELILLDLNLPDGDGLQLVHKIKTVYKIPLIIITSRDTMLDRLTGLESGADDYICKPYHPRELMIRINKLLNNETDCKSEASLIIEISNYCFDKDAHRFYDKEGNDINLTAGEYLIVTRLIEAEGRILSRSQLLDAAFQRVEYPSDRTIDVLVSRLRKKFPVKPNEPEIIDTVKGFGYRLNKAVL